MLLVLVVAKFFTIYSVNGHISMPVIGLEEPGLATCVSKIFDKHLITKPMQVTYVDMGSDENILHDIKITSLSFISRLPKVEMKNYNEIYLIHVGCSNFTDNFQHITIRNWNPRATFIIIKDGGDLKEIFDLLLKHRVMKVVVINRSDLSLHSYAPFDNFTCGRRYDRIIPFGNCLRPNVDKLFPDTLGISLRECTFIVEASDWPPYVVIPGRETFSGVEQDILEIFSEYFHFNLNYIYEEAAETLEIVEMERMRNNEVDVSIGGMLLLNKRVEEFDYITAHLPFSDDIVFLVKKSSSTPLDYLYKESTVKVGSLVTLVFIICCALMIIRFEIKDKSSFVLKMFGTLLGRGVLLKTPAKCLPRVLLVFWVLFAGQIYLHYQTYLTSMATHPLKVYQISDDEDLKTYKVKSCISPVMQRFVETLMFPCEIYSHGCGELLESIRTVSETKEAFTISFESIYLYNKNRFCDKNGCKIYIFDRPVSDILYSMYFHKGFPMLDELNMLSLRIRETGLVDKIMGNIVWNRIKEQSKLTIDCMSLKDLFAIAWFLESGGVVLAFLVFVIELIVGRRKLG